MFAENVKEKLSGYPVVSFDVFDTILIRPFVRPTDVFRLIEKNNYVDGFCKERIDAEKRARRNIDTEISLDEIYKEIDKKYVKYKDIELKYERQLLHINPEIKEVIDDCQKTKIIVLVSDMYLPSAFIRNMLLDNGISVDNVYISNEHRASKYDKRLFDIVISDLGISKEEMIHIGDNRHSDYDMPRSVGIEAIHYISPIDSYFAQHRKEQRFYRRNRNLESSIIVSMDMIYWLYNDKKDSTDYWYDIGFRFGGPATSSFANFITSNTKESDILLFISRDGYNLRNVYNILSGNKEGVYVYAPRLFSILFGNEYKTYQKYSKMLLEHYYPSEPISEMSEAECISLFDQRFQSLKDRMDEDHLRYEKYLRGIVDGRKNITVIDVTTMKFSSQILIQDVFSDGNVDGCYYNVMNSAEEPKHSTFMLRSKYGINWTSINILEFFMNSPERPIRDIDSNGNPLFSDVPECEEYRISIYDEVMKGEIYYAKLMKSIFGDFIPSLSPYDIEKWIKLLTTDTRNNNLIRNIRWAQDITHEEYHSLIFEPGELPYLLRVKIGSILWKLMHSRNYCCRIRRHHTREFKSADIARRFRQPRCCTVPCARVCSETQKKLIIHIDGAYHGLYVAVHPRRFAKPHGVLGAVVLYGAVLEGVHHSIHGHPIQEQGVEGVG